MGGLLLASGSPSVVADDLVLDVSGLPPVTTGLLFVGSTYGPGYSSGRLHGDGTLCLGAPVERSILFIAGANGTATLDHNLVAAHAILAGETRLFQIAYRDAPTVCGHAFNMTNALSVTFAP